MPNTQSPPPPPATGSAAGAPVAVDPYGAAMQLVDHIAALPALDQPALEAVLGVSMAHQAQASPEEQYYEASLPSGTFQRAELRLSNATQEKFALVILDVRAGVRIALASFRSGGRVGSDTRLEVNPNVPPEGTLTYTVHVSGQDTRYVFTGSAQQLTTVVVDRRPSAR